MSGLSTRMLATFRPCIPRHVKMVRCVADIFATGRSIVLVEFGERHNERTSSMAKSLAFYFTTMLRGNCFRGALRGSELDQSRYSSTIIDYTTRKRDYAISSCCCSRRDRWILCRKSSSLEAHAHDDDDDDDDK